ncbi:MAG: transcription-repair coupling factor [Desulfovibrionaceae bacterium]|nr:transcription-repair coupling factor [Desulfovibrionaceae bacterium]
MPPAILELIDGKRRSCRVYKSGAGTRAAVAAALLARGRSVAWILPDEKSLAEARALLDLLAQPADGQAGDRAEGKAAREARALRPAWERRWLTLPPFPAASVAEDLAAGESATAKAALRWAERMAGLFSLGLRAERRGLLLTADNLLAAFPPRDVFESNHILLKKGDDMSPELLLEQAVEWGYARVTLATRPGETALRGDILDIFPPGLPMPLRLEFFGDTLDEMRVFDPVSQRSRGDLDEVYILPAAPAVGGGGRIETARHRLKALVKGGGAGEYLHRLVDRRLDLATGDVPPGLYYENPSRIWDWLGRDTVFLHFSAQDLRTMLEEDGWALDGALEREFPDEPHPRALLADEAATALARLEQAPHVVFEDLVMGVERDGVDLDERSYETYQDLFAGKGLPAGQGPEDFKERPWQALVKAMAHWTATRRQTVLSFHSEAARRKFLALAEQESIRPRTSYSDERGLYALISPFAKGFELLWTGLLVLGEDVLLPGGRARPVTPRDAFRGLDRYDDLATGELLVHRDYGLGRFAGLHRMQAGGVGNDFLLLEYSEDDKLYLPVDRLSLVQRYKGPEDTAPSLDRLGGAGWTKSREKARKAVEQIARDLVEMYAYRRVAKGFAYGPVDELYREFEAGFGFEETPDQERAIRDVLGDMEKPEPMDRLVCGDVGFGKTEVALRAAVRAALEGRQVALLCPTTVLAEQHYQTFRARLKGLPLHVAMLSRFVPRAKQTEVIKAASRGAVDILIGTHRLLSKDIDLPHLGLMILDEEQRFGVRHKERLKEMRRTIDAITLTATPIPRTLQLSLSGVRELSVIETPPPERKPVKTALAERDPEMLKAVLERELGRGGQVFWVHNRVQGLTEVLRFVQKLVPGARVGMAHGQMTERALEDAMHAFWHGETDVLVCTAIVESGLDFPRANTLIVDQAQLFGLGQLYQLRGRVGRSERQAYAYFVVRDLDNLPDMARKRLKIILDMDYLGAGFRVAMEDLRLRGAGNILGEAQSGHIAKVGLDLFLEMLEDEVRRVKGDPGPRTTEPELAIGVQAHIPEEYMDDPGERLKYYKSLSSARDQETRLDIQAEIRDRFGPLPEPLLNFLAVLDLKAVLARLQAEKADVYPTALRVAFGPSTDAVAPTALVEWMARQKGAARLVPPSTLELRLDEKGTIRQRLERACAALSQLATGPQPSTHGEQ